MSVRPAAVAGVFYPADPHALEAQIQTLLHQTAPAEKRRAVAAIVPHAGYIFSGAVAANALSAIDFTSLDCILLLGPSHRVALQGMAVPACQAFATPLGHYPLAEAIAGSVVEAGLAEYNDRAHQMEHSLEVQVPFLQVMGLAIPLLPVVIGYEEPSTVAALIEYVTSRWRTLVLISSDLSHFHTYAEATLKDECTSRKILSLNTRIQPDEACGSMALNGLLCWLQTMDKTVERLMQCNSGDTAGDKQSVVGYGAYIVYA